MKRFTFVSLIVILAILLAGCEGSSNAEPQQPNTDPNTLQIVAGSEVKTLADAGVFDDFTKQSGVKVNLTFKGSVDIKNAISQITSNNPKTVDVFWPASSLQLSGNPSVTPVSAMKTYVLVMIDPQVVKSLGWDPKNVTSLDFINAVKDQKIHLAMTSASQSNSGQTFYIAALTALCGSTVLTTDCLNKADVTDNIKALLAGIDRSSESSGKLLQVFIDDKTSGANKFNAMVTYESLLIDGNKQLIAKGASPYMALYLKDAVAIADSPIMYVDNGNQAKLDMYKKLTTYLTSADVEKKIQSLGWRTNQIGMAVENADPNVFNPAWGIDTKTEFPLMKYPKPAVVTNAIDTYQTLFRKPSATVYCLDSSTSMESNGGRGQMTDAMDLLLDQNRAREYSLQATSRDITVVYTFSSRVKEIGEVTGNDQTALKNLSKDITTIINESGTAMFDCLIAALGYVGNNYDPSYSWAIIAMTDGASNTGADPSGFESAYQSFTSTKGYSIPVYGIAFGDPDFNQLNTLKITGGDVYDGRSDVATAFRKAKGNN